MGKACACKDVILHLDERGRHLGTAIQSLTTELWLKNNLRLIFYWVKQIIIDDEAVSEAVQDVCLSFLQKRTIEAYVASEGPFLPFVRKCTHNAVRETWRRYRPSPIPPSHGNVPSPEDSILGKVDFIRFLSWYETEGYQIVHPMTSTVGLEYVRTIKLLMKGMARKRATKILGVTEQCLYSRVKFVKAVYRRWATGAFWAQG